LFFVERLAGEVVVCTQEEATSATGGFSGLGRQALFVLHFEERQVGQLFDALSVGEFIMTEDIAVVSKLGDERGCDQERTRTY
jgi:hypothetical protein